MSIRVALNHRTEYRYERNIHLGPQVVRLRPAPHCRTPVSAYSLKVNPENHFQNWQQDPHANYLSRYNFNGPTDLLRVEVDLIADMTVINPFDFFVEPYAEKVPFEYEPALRKQLQLYLEAEEATPRLRDFSSEVAPRGENSNDFLVALNQRLEREIDYLVRMEPGVQSAEETLVKKSGSCRDSAWLLVQVLRHLGFAARFVSGYLIQLKPDVEALDGPSGSGIDFTDLHAWTEVFLPGAGWIGLDPTSGLFAGEGHLPLACTPHYRDAAPITGGVEPCEVHFDFSMTLKRIDERPRVTLPYSETQWEAITRLGHSIDQRLQRQDVRLTMGGEPTFVSIDDMEGDEWTFGAVGPDKRVRSNVLLQKLNERFAAGGLLHYGQGKWYPGEPLPRWALTCLWRTDGQPLWSQPELLADEGLDYGYGPTEAEQFASYLADSLEVAAQAVMPAYEDVFHYLWKEQRLPANVDPTDSKLKDPEERARLTRIFSDGLGRPTGYILPLRRQWWQARPRWISGRWPVKAEQIYLLPGDSPAGLRLPLDSLPHVPAGQHTVTAPLDPTENRAPLPQYAHDGERPPAGRVDGADGEAEGDEKARTTPSTPETAASAVEASDVIPTALCVEPRHGRLYVFMPPVERLEDYIDLTAAIEQTASDLEMPVIIEGYLPPADHRVQYLKVTPDPGVIEVNTQPTASWDELVTVTTGLYEDARQSRLGTEKFDLDGKHSGTGGGNHIVLGGSTPADSPFLRRPDLLKSMVAFWNNHPSLTYLFSGRFVGPTSQAPRFDEGRRDAVYEMEIAFDQVPPPGEPCPPWLVDRIFRNLLVDLTGNTHRAEFCIDKLYSPDSASGRLGLVELRGFEMPPHARMSLTQQLLIRALVSAFWESPYRQPLVHWQTSLYDRFMLPHYVWQDFQDVLSELASHQIVMQAEWFHSHFEFRFAKIGSVSRRGVTMELRTAIEPWYVLGEEPAGGATARYVDSSVERLQIKLSGLIEERYTVVCNGHAVPLRPTGVEGEFVAGIRYRAWQPPSCLHPTIPVHSPLVFDIYDHWAERSIGGCTYHVSHPGGRGYETFPVNANEAEARRTARFFANGHTPGTFQPQRIDAGVSYPITSDLRRPVLK